MYKNHAVNNKKLPSPEIRQLTCVVKNNLIAWRGKNLRRGCLCY
jgi:hypothetical protein